MAKSLLNLMLTSVLPLALDGVWRRVRGTTGELQVSACGDAIAAALVLAGMATGSNVASAILIFRDALAKTASSRSMFPNSG